MKETYKTFIFHDYDFLVKEKKLTLTYSLDEKVFFEENFFFDFPINPSYAKDAFEQACFAIFVMAGISYYKAAIPKEIKFKKHTLTKQQKEFFDTVYQKGLGQFFYENKIDPRYPIHFPFNANHKIAPQKIAKAKGSLLAFGGGKDSLLSGEILKTSHTAFATWTVGDHPAFLAATRKLSNQRLNTRRTIAPSLLDLNKKGALNGHVPITGILSFVAVASAILQNKQYVIFSNDSSTREPNTIYKGQKINHQFSKTLEFEKLIQKYIAHHISPDIEYFSLLRPLSQLRIAELFCKQAFYDYQGLFSSCNRNFIQGKKQRTFFWCGECAKCAFTFLLFSPFVPKDELVRLFNGKNLFLDPKLRKAYKGMLGISGIKPLDCVGEIEEMKTAMDMAKKTGHYPELKIFSYSRPTFQYKTWRAESMPLHMKRKVQQFIKIHS